MSSFLEDISQITIYLKNEKDAEERVNEVAIFQPLAKNPQLEEDNFVLQQRKWSFLSHLSFTKKIIVKIEQFVYQKFSFFIRKERRSVEAKFKTVVAILLSQESLTDFFLSDEDKRQNFFQALKHAAEAFGYKEFTIPKSETPYQIARLLTTLNKKSLLDDPEELNLQMATLDHNERDQILYEILNQIERPNLQSVVEITDGEELKKISLTTTYAKYKILSVDEESGEIVYHSHYNETEVNIKNQEKKVMNQHLVLDEKNSVLAGVCGELLDYTQVFEQVLFLLQEEGAFFIEKFAPTVVTEKTILFTSLFSWNEYDKIMDQHFAIEKLHGKILKLIKSNGEIKYFRLNLHHLNIAFNAFNKFPSPSELQASINDINDKTMLFLSDLVLSYPPLHKLTQEYQKKREQNDFLRKENDLLNCVDRFNLLKKEIIDQLDESAPHVALRSLLLRPISSIDMLIYISYLTSEYGIIHNINCDNAIDRSAGALSIIKAQNAFKLTLNKPYLPSICTQEETALFRVFYSLYLVFEEPELNAGLTTGFVGEKFYHNFLQRNPETTTYLIPWLKKHPEMYLGLSRFRH